MKQCRKKLHFYTIFLAGVLCLSFVTSGRTLPVRYCLELHLAADQLAGLQDNDTVSSWTDLSSKNRNATQTAAEKRPIYKANVLNGKPVIRFDGVDDFLSFSTISNIRTVFWVVKEDSDASANSRCILGHSSAKYFHRGWPKQIWSSAYAEPQVLNGITKINNIQIDAASVDVPTDFSIISIATSGSASADQITRDRTFNDRVWDGDIAEIIIFSRILTDNEENEVGAYLQEKYNLPAGYPSSEKSLYVPVRPGTGSLASSASSPLTVTMDLSKVRQKIQNFGASDCWSVQYVGNWPQQKTQAIADLLFSTGLDQNGKPRGIGLSLWRTNLGAGSSRQTNIYDHWRRADFYYNQEKTAYDWTRCPGQRNFMQLAKQRGVEQFLAFCNSPPITMTKNGNAFCDASVGATNLDPQKRGEFAIYLADVLAHFRDVEGIDFSVISPFNEPEWDWNDNSSQPGYSSQEGCRYNNLEMKEFVNVLYPQLQSRGLKTEIEICESGSLEYLYTNGDDKGNHVTQFFDSAAGNFIGDKLPGMISSHSYWTDTGTSMVTKRQSLRTKLNQYGLNCAQTEYCILGDRGEINGNGRDLGIGPGLWIARVIHNDMVVAETEAWQWWLAISPSDYKDGLVYCDYNDTDGAIYESKMLWSMGNFSRFIRPGMYRIEVARSDGKTHSQVLEELMVSGYYSFAHHAAVVVCVNYSYSDRPVHLDFSNVGAQKPIEYMIPYVTRGDNLVVDSLTPYAALRTNQNFTVPARSIVTLVAMENIDGDVNLDQEVNWDDLLIMIQHWLDADCTDCGWADSNQDNHIEMNDLAAFSRNWLTGPTMDFSLAWNFDELQGGSTIEAVTQTLCPLVNMDPECRVAGHQGGALNFSAADDYVDIPDIDLGGEWTLDFWAKGNVSSPYGSIVLGNRGDNNNYFYMWDGTMARFQNSTGQYADWTTDTRFYSQWRRVTLTARSDSIDLYLDGVLQGTRNIISSFKLYTLGAGHSNPNFNFNGCLDEVRLYHRTLTREEIEYMNY